METTLKITPTSWNKLKKSLKEKYPDLTDADLTFSAGKEDELLASLSTKLGKTKTEVSDLIEDLQSESEEETEEEQEKKENTRKYQ